MFLWTHANTLSALTIDTRTHFALTSNQKCEWIGVSSPFVYLTVLPQGVHRLGVKLDVMTMVSIPDDAQQVGRGHWGVCNISNELF